jgi:MoaA/NifB/PqqE/SkfB family radical SAM enzyme
MVNLSLDAVGPRFDEVRRDGNWAKTEPRLLAFVRRRDPCRMTVGLSPTVTRRTLNDLLPILDWGAEHGIDTVSFHRYSPIRNSTEEDPTPEERKVARGRIQHWIASRTTDMEVIFDGERLSHPETAPALRRTEVACAEKRAIVETFSVGRYFFGPTGAESAVGDPLVICTAPWHYVEVGLDGQIGACCRAQDVPLGYATSAEAFADAWLGSNYRKIRESLNRSAEGPYPLPNCEGCVDYFAPQAGNRRSAVDYALMRPQAMEALSLDLGAELLLEDAQAEQGHCWTARLPPALHDKSYEVWEDDKVLGPGNSQHYDIRKLGGGRYSIWGRSLYFSTSDNTDPRRNGRRYTLRASNMFDASKKSMSVRRDLRAPPKSM